MALSTNHPKPVVREIIFQASPYCNLNCSYCYLPDRRSKARMEIHTIRNAIRKVLDAGLASELLGIEFHAGEPLAVPRAFYEEALRAIREETAGRVRTRITLQTNGTLIDQAWCEFLAAHGIGVGVSVDGPEWIHDARRKNWAGKGTHAQTMRGIRLLQQNGLSFGVISVLTRESVEHPDELFGFYQENGLDLVGFNPEEAEGAHSSSSLSTAEGETAFRAFLARLLELIRTSGSRMKVREFVMMGGMICGGEGQGMADAQPFGILTVGSNGDFITFSPELFGVKSAQYDDFVLGNVNRDRLEDVLASPRLASLRADVAAGIEACRQSCPYFRLCGGGSPSNKFGEHGCFTATETVHCRLRKQAVADVMLADFESVLAGGGSGVRA